MGDSILFLGRRGAPSNWGHLCSDQGPTFMCPLRLYFVAHGTNVGHRVCADTLLVLGLQW